MQRIVAMLEIELRFNVLLNLLKSFLIYTARLEFSSGFSHWYQRHSSTHQIRLHGEQHHTWKSLRSVYFQSQDSCLWMINSATQ